MMICILPDEASGHLYQPDCNPATVIPAYIASFIIRIMHCARASIFVSLFRSGRQHLVNVDTQLPQIHLGQINLLHQLLVRGRDVVESEDAPAETEEE